MLEISTVVTGIIVYLMAMWYGFQKYVDDNLKRGTIKIRNKK